MIEMEKKMLLTRQEYEYLLACFGQTNRSIKQINYYFDTDDLAMNAQNITCRIRLKDNKYKGTMKHHVANADYSIETDIEVRNGVFDNAFIDMGLKLQGTLTTERHIILRDSNYEVVLDKNDYLGYTDYELEFEWLPNSEKNFNFTVVSILDILPYRIFSLPPQDIILRCKETKSKSKRFFARRLENDFDTQRDI